MAESIKFSMDLPVSPERVYRAWLDSYEHSQFTGSPAKIEGSEGGTYTAFDGYIRGKNLVLTPFTRIRQSWRIPDFADNDPDHEVELLLEATCLGTQLTLTHTGIPSGQSAEYLKNWEENYFIPLRDYFDELVGDAPADMGDG